MRLHEFYDEVYEKSLTASRMNTRDDSSFRIKLKNASVYVNRSMIRRKGNITQMDKTPVATLGYNEVPLQSTWSLYCNQIFIEVQSWNRNGPESIVFHVFDVANDMTKRK